MSFHIATFRLLGFEPKISSAQETEVRQAEKRLGVSFPQSIRDWYIRKDAIKILAEHSNDDPPVSIDEFALMNWQSHKLLPIRHENQGVCTWAVDLNGLDDPPVYVDVDTNGREWNLLASCFSEYVYSCIWDYRMVFRQPALVQAQNGALSRAAIDTLTAKFKKEIETHGWPGSTQYRFINGQQAVLLWSAEDQADWFIAAPTAELLESALASVWGIDNVGKQLYDCSKPGKDVLVKIRNRS